MTSNPNAGRDSELAPVWQRRFAFFDRYGLPNGSREGLMAARELSFVERMQLNSNILAFLFGPFYFMVKGMWRKGLTLLLAELAGVVVVVLAGWPLRYLQFGLVAVSLAAMMTANYAYYLQVRRGSTWWNPYEGFGRPKRS